MLAGYDTDLAAEATRLTNRLHDALQHIHPALERLVGKHFRRRGVLEPLAAAGTPARLRELVRTARAKRSPSDRRSHLGEDEQAAGLLTGQPDWRVAPER